MTKHVPGFVLLKFVLVNRNTIWDIICLTCCFFLAFLCSLAW